MFVSGFVSVVGRPNVGKSTLINAFMGQKVLIVSDKPQTTRNNIQAILTTEKAQVIFVDTPGVHRPKHRLGETMVRSALRSLQEVDLVLFMVEATAPPGPGDRYLADILQKVKVPLFLVVNKVDLAPRYFQEEWDLHYRELAGFEKCFAVSALQGEGVSELLQAIIEMLPPGPMYYPSDMYLDRPEEFLVGEIIREKIFVHTREEIPHSVAVEVSSMEYREEKNLLEIRAVVFVEKESQKGIVIGKDGALLKKVGTAARQELERVFQVPIFIDLWVKVKKDWRRKDNVLRQLGYE